MSTQKCAFVCVCVSEREREREREREKDRQTDRNTINWKDNSSVKYRIYNAAKVNEITVS